MKTRAECGRNPQLCLDTYISSNSSNLLQFLQISYCTVYIVKEKEGKTDTKHRTPSLWLKKPIQKPQV
jgi:hypothetical protein